MIPENLQEKWELAQARAEVMFLADNGGGYPNCLASPVLTPAARRAILRRMSFRVMDEYDMPSPKNWDERWPWVRLTNNVAVCLMDGFVSRAPSDRRRRK